MAELQGSFCRTDSYGSKLYFVTRESAAGTYNVYLTSLSGKNKKTVASGLTENLYELGKVTSRYIYFEDFFSHGWKYDRKNNTYEEMDRTAYMQAIN